jgi:hypothetical protein
VNPCVTRFIYCWEDRVIPSKGGKLAKAVYKKTIASIINHNLVYNPKIINRLPK